MAKSITKSDWIVLGALAVGLLVAYQTCSSWWDHLGEEYAAKQAAEKAEYKKTLAEAVEHDRAEKKRREDEARKKAELAAIEAARPPSERAKLAVIALTADAGEDGICRAHELLDPVSAKDRAAQDVRGAVVLLAQKEAAQLRSERPAFEARRGLVCGDSTFSGCSCTGSHRGCCSHHGGVAGCEPYPTKVSCPAR